MRRFVEQRASPSGRRDRQQRWTFRRIITTLESCETGSVGWHQTARRRPHVETTYEAKDIYSRSRHFSAALSARSSHRSFRDMSVSARPAGDANNSMSTDLESNHGLSALSCSVEQYHNAHQPCHDLHKLRRYTSTRLHCILSVFCHWDLTHIHEFD